MPVTLPETVARDIEHQIEKRIQDYPSDRLLGIALGEITDDEVETLRRFRQAMRQSVNGGARKAPRSRQTVSGRSIAIGRHAYDYLTSHEWVGEAEHVLREATPRKTLVGLRVPEDTVRDEYVSVLRDGAVRSRADGDELTATRLERAAERLAA